MPFFVGLWVVLCAACVDRKPGLSPTTGSPGEACVEPGLTANCYTGPTGTKGVGACTGGFTTCTWALTWSACEEETVPSEDICTNAIDDDCDGKVDEGADNDGDGWGVCNGDCCDDVGCAADPKRVNPGAFEADGNLLDDDCDGTIDNVDPPCVLGDTSEPMAYARALDLCKVTQEDVVGIDQRWGVIDAKLSRADGMPLPNMNQAAISTHFGANTPRFGSTLVVLATGNAVDHDNPNWQPWQRGTDMQTASSPDGSAPASWLSANGGTFPNAPGCPPPNGGVNDPVMLTLKIRVPTNASSFNISSNFFSSEYPEYVCSPFNDFFIILLKSDFKGEPANPRDGNLAIYTDQNGDKFPVGVNLAQGTDLFQQCMNGMTGCRTQDGAVPGTATGCVATADLANTGFDLPGSDCDANTVVGGATGWLNTTGNVVPGEIIELRIAIWDTSDPSFDSAALVDAFRWNIDPTTPGTGMIPQ